MNTQTAFGGHIGRDSWPCPGLRRRLVFWRGLSPRFPVARLVFLTGLCTLALTLVLLTPIPHAYVAASGARYLVLAQSITRGTYKLDSSPLWEAEVSVPPLWPATLAVASTLSSSREAEDLVPLAQGLTFAIFLALLVCTFLFAEGRAGVGTAGTVALLVAVQPAMLTFARSATAEMPFALLLVATLWAGASAIRRRSGGRMLAALVLGIASAYVHPLGAVLVLVLVQRLAGVFPGRRKALLAALLALLVWPLRQTAVVMLGAATTPTFTEAFREALGGRSYPAAVWGNVLYYEEAVVGHLFPTELLQDPILRLSLPVVLLGLVAAGLVLDRSRDRTLTGTAFVAIALAILAWPAPSVRQVVPLLPLALYFAAVALSELTRLAVRHFGFRRADAVAQAAPLLLLLLLLPYLRWNFDAARHSEGASGRIPAEWGGFYRGVDWVGTHTADEPVVLARYPEAAYLAAAVPALPLESGWSLVRQREGEASEWDVWVVRDAFPGQFPIGRRALTAAGAHLEHVDANTGVEVWRLPRRPARGVRVIAQGAETRGR